MDAGAASQAVGDELEQERHQVIDGFRGLGEPADVLPIHGDDAPHPAAIGDHRVGEDHPQAEDGIGDTPQQIAPEIQQRRLQPISALQGIDGGVAATAGLVDDGIAGVQGEGDPRADQENADQDGEGIGEGDGGDGETGVPQGEEDGSPVNGSVGWHGGIIYG